MSAWLGECLFYLRGCRRRPFVPLIEVRRRHSLAFVPNNRQLCRWGQNGDRPSLNGKEKEHFELELNYRETETCFIKKVTTHS